MKFIQYYDKLDATGVVACCVSAFSVRKYSGFKDCEYVFYTPDYLRIRNNKNARRVFDEILPLPDQANDIINNLPPWCQNIRTNNRALCCWRKFLCWLFTPGTTMFTDNDIICVGNIEDAIPPDGYIISGRRAGLNGVKVGAINGGMLIKNDAFDKTNAQAIMLESLLDKRAWSISQDNWHFYDEAATWWLFYRCGQNEFFELDERYNAFARNHVPTKKTLEQRDIRLLHFIGKTKPWKKCPLSFRFLKGRWLQLREEMYRMVDKR